MASMIGIGTHMPVFTQLPELQEELGLCDVEIRRFRRAFGYETVCRAPGESEADILVAAVRDIPGFDDLRKRVRWVVRAKTVRIVSPWPYQPLTEACRRLGLSHARCFTVTDLACASGMLAVEVATRLLQQDGDPSAIALVLAGEKTFGKASQLIPNVALLGEATAAAALSLDEGADELLGFAAQQVSILGDSLALDEGSTERFSAIYGPTMQAAIIGALEAAGVSVSDIASYLPHNVSRIVSMKTARALGLSGDLIDPGTLATTAHCWSADTFLNLRAATDAGRLAPGDVYLMTSVGLGASFGALVCRRKDDAEEGR